MDTVITKQSINNVCMIYIFNTTLQKLNEIKPNIYYVYKYNVKNLNPES